MEHPCYRCGTQIEEGVAFCPNCNAPQIRVTGSTENEPATPPLRPGTPDDLQPPAHPVDLQHRPYAPDYGRPDPSSSAGIQWSDALPGSLLAGVIIAVTWIIPLASFFLWPVAAGALAVALYLRRRPETFVTGATGARLGAISGLFGFAFFVLMMVIDLVALHGGGKMRQAMEEVIQQSAARNANPEAQAMMQRLLSPEGVAILITIVLVIFLAAFIGFGAVGGAVGARLLAKTSKTERRGL